MLFQTPLSCVKFPSGAKVAEGNAGSLGVGLSPRREFRCAAANASAENSKCQSALLGLAARPYLLKQRTLFSCAEHRRLLSVLHNWNVSRVHWILDSSRQLAGETHPWVITASFECMHITVARLLSESHQWNIEDFYSCQSQLVRRRERAYAHKVLNKWNHLT